MAKFTHRLLTPDEAAAEFGCNRSEMVNTCAKLDSLVRIAEKRNDFEYWQKVSPDIKFLCNELCAIIDIPMVKGDKGNIISFAGSLRNRGAFDMGYIDLEKEKD